MTAKSYAANRKQGSRAVGRSAVLDPDGMRKWREPAARMMVPFRTGSLVQFTLSLRGFSF